MGIWASTLTYAARYGADDEVLAFLKKHSNPRDKIPPARLLPPGGPNGRAWTFLFCREGTFLLCLDKFEFDIDLLRFHV